MMFSILKLLELPLLSKHIQTIECTYSQQSLKSTNNAVNERFRSTIRYKPSPYLDNNKKKHLNSKFNPATSNDTNKTTTHPISHKKSINKMTIPDMRD